MRRMMVRPCTSSAGTVPFTIAIVESDKDFGIVHLLCCYDLGLRTPGSRPSWVLQQLPAQCRIRPLRYWRLRLRHHRPPLVERRVTADIGWNGHCRQVCFSDWKAPVATTIRVACQSAYLGVA